MCQLLLACNVIQTCLCIPDILTGTVKNWSVVKCMFNTLLHFVCYFILKFSTSDFPILTVRPSSITVNSSETARLVCKGEALEAPSTNWFRLTGEGTFDVRNNERIIVTVEGEMIIQVGFAKYHIISCNKFHKFSIKQIRMYRETFALLGK